MYAPPSYLTGADLATLLRFVGVDQFRKLAHVSERTLRRWLATGEAPLGYVRLAWYASDHGREAAELDIANELRAQHARAESIAAALDKRLPLLHVPRYLADACNEALFAAPTPRRHAGRPPWHPGATSRHYHHPEESA